MNINSLNNLNNASALFGSSSSSASTSFYAASKNDLFNSMMQRYGTNTATSASNSVKSYVSTLKSSGSALSDVISKLLDKNSSKNSIYNQKTIASSNSDVLTVSNTSSMTATEKNSLSSTKVSVDVLAAAQQNKGTALNSNELSLEAFKTQSMTITDSKGKSLSFSVNPTSSQNNLKVQNQLAETINKSGLNVTAKVEVDNVTKKSSLVITSKDTGKDSEFKVEGALAESLGVTNATTKASDAVYTVNGERKSSSTNDVEISGVKATLKGVSNKDVTFTEQTDTKNLINSVRSMVNSYNKMLEAAKDNNDDSGAARLENSLASLVKTYEKSLSEIGISTNKNGYLEIDADQMAKAADNGTLQKFASNSNGGTSYGFVSKLGQIASKASSDPTQYLSQENKSVSDTSEYLQSAFNSNSKVTNLYSKLNNYYSVGMLFESMF